jgi:molybdopterin biosynthesis enzyme MoaB
MNQPEEIEVLIITLSDRASGGEYEDLSGPRISQLVTEHFLHLNIKCSITALLIPDNAEELRDHKDFRRQLQHHLYNWRYRNWSEGYYS